MKEYFPNFHEDVKDISISQSWMKAFKERNSCKSMKGQSIEKSRAVHGTIGNIQNWFDTVYNKVDLNQIDKANIGNFDETMLQCNGNQWCIVKKEAKHALYAENDFTEHITIGTLVTTNGDSMTPLFIFPLKTIPACLQSLITDCRITVAGQESGWMNTTIMMKWAEEFVKWVKSRNIARSLPESAPFLLFLDDHSSRDNPDLLDYLEENNVIGVSFPSHCSHLLQPLDVWVFKEFKKYLSTWKKKFNAKKYVLEDGSEIPDKTQTRLKLVLAAINALHQSLAPQTIMESFRLSGIFPRDVQKPLQNYRISHDDKVPVEKGKAGLPMLGAIITDKTLREKVRGKSLRKRKKADSK